MRKIFSLLFAILFASSMMAEVGSLYYTFLPYKPSSGAVSDYTKTGTMTIDEMNWTVPGNWYGNGALRLGGKSIDGVDRVISAQDAMGSAIAKIRIAHAGKTADALTLNSITVTTASDADFTKDVTETTVTDFTVAKNTKDTIDVVPATEPWAKDSYYKFAFNLSNPNGSNYAFVVESILFYAPAEGGGAEEEEEEDTNRTIYLNGGGSSLWNQAGAVFFIHAWGGTGVDVKMTQVEGDVYSASIPSDNTSLLFVRMPSGSEAINWDTKWNQSSDQTIPADKNLFTMTDWSNGTWSVYGETPEPPTPVEMAYYLVGTMNNWQAAEAYKFAPAEAEGEYILHTTLAENDEIKVIKVENETTTWYPAQGGNYVVDAAHAGEKDIYFRPAGNADWSAFGGYFWMGENQEVPEADFTKPFVLKFNGTGESGKDNSNAFAAEVAAIFDAASAPYVASVEKAEKVYAGRPIADDNSSVKFGTTSAQGALEFTLAQAIDVDSIVVNATQYGNNAAKITINGTEFDLTAGNKKPQDCKITPESAVSAISIAQSGTERIYLRSVSVYPHVETPAEPKFYITGDSALVVDAGLEKAQAWNAAAIAAMEVSHKLNLKAGVAYKLKVTVDGTWTDGKVKGFSALTTQAKGLSADGDDNICFMLNADGEVNVHYDGEYFFLNGDFYVAPAPEQTYYLKNNWDGAEEWTWKAMTKEDEDDYQLLCVFGGTGFDLNTSESEEGKIWFAAEDIMAVDAVSGDFVTLEALDTVVMMYTPSESMLAAYVLGKYVAPVLPKFYITGDSALVVDAGLEKAQAWNAAAIAAMEVSHKLNLKANVPYKLKVTVDGTWTDGKVKGFSALTTQAKGLSADGDDNICFMLNADGEVNVHYDGEYFFLNGDFYVAPAPEQTYYLKNNWDGAEEWTWKAMTKEDEDDYQLLCVFGGTGFDLNTSESEEGKIWFAAEDIMAVDAVSGDFVTLEALDTVVMMYTPSEEMLAAYVLGKYVAPVLPKFYITGDSALVVDAGLEKAQAWNAAAIAAMEVSHKLNLKANVPYKLKVTVDGTWTDGKVKGFSALTTQAKGLSADGDDNICFMLNADGEVNVHYDGEYFFLNGDFYVAPAPEQTYYLKNNWDGAEEWTWKAMTKEDEDDYQLLCVFGGTGFDLNTSESEEGKIWFAAEDIMAVDAVSGDFVTLEALDTVVMMYTPSESMLAAYVLGKYVAPEVPELVDGFYLVGNFTDWKPAEGYLFSKNPENEAEYMFTTTLVEGNEFKVVEVKDGQYNGDSWFPKEGGNYVVDAAHAGEKTIYFRPDYQGGEGWHAGCIYVAPNSPTGIDAIDDNAPAVKIHRNGQLLIIKGGKAYNAIGLEVRK